jgi:hypothetical protein
MAESADAVQPDADSLRDSDSSGSSGIKTKLRTSADVFSSPGFSWLIIANGAMFAGFQMRNMGQA